VYATAGVTGWQAVAPGPLAIPGTEITPYNGHCLAIGLRTSYDRSLSVGLVAGTRVFIVEDEALILFNLQDMLEELGCVVVASAARIHVPQHRTVSHRSSSL